MITRNRFGNATNPYQTTAKKVLTVCSAGLLRSPTTAKVLGEEFDYNCRAAGISDDYALVRVNELLIYWADEIVFVEQSVADQFFAAYPDANTFKYRILALPDMYSWNDDVLVSEILIQYNDLESYPELEE